MTAPTYRRFTYLPMPTRVGPFRWAWEVTDGIGGPVLLSGTTRTRGGADRARVFASAQCEPALELRLDWIVSRLHDDGIDVEFSVDERRHVCVKPCCKVSTRDEVRALREFLAITSDVEWVTA